MFPRGTLSRCSFSTRRRQRALCKTVPLIHARMGNSFSSRWIIHKPLSKSKSCARLCPSPFSDRVFFFFSFCFPSRENLKRSCRFRNVHPSEDTPRFSNLCPPNDRQGYSLATFTPATLTQFLRVYFAGNLVPLLLRSKVNAKVVYTLCLPSLNECNSIIFFLKRYSNVLSLFYPVMLA